MQEKIKLGTFEEVFLGPCIGPAMTKYSFPVIPKYSKKFLYGTYLESILDQVAVDKQKREKIQEKSSWISNIPVNLRYWDLNHVSL